MRSPPKNRSAAVGSGGSGQENDDDGNLGAERAAVKHAIAQVISIEDAKARRGEQLLRDEEPADEMQERRAWGDRSAS